MKKILLAMTLISAGMASQGQLTISGGSWMPIGDTQLFMSCDDSLGGDGEKDGGLYVNGLSAVVGLGTMYTFGGTATTGETINIVTNTFNSVASFVAFDIQLYNISDGTITTSTNELILAGSPTVNSVLSYTATSSDDGDVMALRFVRTDDGNEARDFIIDNASLNSNTIPVCAGENIILNTAVTVTGLALSANYKCGDYQWINCSDNSPIAGETSSEFTATEDGVYAVIITEGDCSDTSECVTITHFGLEESHTSFLVFPNPTSDFLQVKTTAVDVSNIEIRDISGKIIQKLDAIPNSGLLDVQDLHPGIYFVKLKVANRVLTEKFIKE